MRSGQGRLEIKGEVDARSAGAARVDLRISGQDVQVAKLPEALVEISPELRLQGSGPYHLSGTLKVPRSKIELRELPRSTVAVSDDEIVVGEQEETADRAPKNLTASVRVELGDDVSFKGFGLQTKLGGILNAATDGDGTRLDGAIELRDARYQAYGQDLTVERGRLLFAGPPSNPDIDLRAVRESRDGRIKAYLTVSGPLAKPTSRVYSEPALAQAEALAYLLTGRGLDDVGKGEGTDIASAALGLGISKGDPLLQDLGDRLGLDQLSLDSGAGAIEDSSLVLGKYLNPDLYLGYSQGLFNPEGAVLLRLKVTERLEVESRSGDEQSIDLFYRLEHD
jgi:translocation and assembly module TamB